MLNPNANTLCVFCKSEVDSMNHVLLHCHMIWRVWSVIVKWWNLNWVIPSSMEAILHWWSGTKCKFQVKEIWKVVPLALMWSVWKLRNECLFKEAKPYFVELIELVKVRVAMWAK